MARHSSTEWAVFLADGYDLLASKDQNLNFKITSATERVDGLGDTWVKNSPTGLLTASLTQAGAFFDDATAGIHAAFAAATDVLRVVCFTVTGNAVGKSFFGMQGTYGSSYAVVGKVGNLTKADVTYTVTGQIDKGVVVLPQAVQTANWTTVSTPIDYTTDPSQRVIPITSNTNANPSVVTTPVPHGLTTGQVILISGVSTSSPTINGERTVTVISPTTFSVPVNVTVAGTGGSFVLSSTVNGGVAYQAVSAFTGFTGVIGKIRHSADNVTYADLATFANVTTAPVAERVTVAAGTTVNRYLCSTGTVTGSGSITPFAGFARS